MKHIRSRASQVRRAAAERMALRPSGRGKLTASDHQAALELRLHGILTHNHPLEPIHCLCQKGVNFDDVTKFQRLWIRSVRGGCARSLVVSQGCVASHIDHDSGLARLPETGSSGPSEQLSIVHWKRDGVRKKADAAGRSMHCDDHRSARCRQQVQRRNVIRRASNVSSSQMISEAITSSYCAGQSVEARTWLRHQAQLRWTHNREPAVPG